MKNAWFIKEMEGGPMYSVRNTHGVLKFSKLVLHMAYYVHMVYFFSSQEVVCMLYSVRMHY